MRTHEAPGGTRFHHNSDLSGDVVVVPPDGGEFQVSGEDLVDFVLERYLRDTLSTWLENVNLRKLIDRLTQ